MSAYPFAYNPYMYGMNPITYSPAEALSYYPNAYNPPMNSQTVAPVTTTTKSSPPLPYYTLYSQSPSYPPPPPLYNA